jgi:thiol-disulfide isomerase/thioredoxin
VVVSTFKAGMIGEFTLSIAEIEVKEAKPQALTFDKGKAVVDSELTDNDAMLLMGNKFHKRYTFKGEAGKSYKIDLHSKAFDAYLYLKDDAGETLMENDDNGESLDSRIIYKVGKAGTYHIIATSLVGGRTGKFTLTVSEPTQADKLMARAKDLSGAPPAEQKQILKELQQHFETLGGKLSQADASLALRIGQGLEDSNKQLAAEAFTSFGKLLATATDPKVAQQSKMLIGAGKRLSLVGNAMEVKGTTIDGKEFDLAKLKGKVVLVDFWATWCGPCRAELPSVKKHYEKYHDKGFEVIGISLDNAKTDLTGFLDKEKLPWTSIFDQANALADDYGVFSIPLAVLVGRDGRVLSLNARGAELDRLLEEQFGGKK